MTDKSGKTATPKRDRALAAWESVAARGVNPSLSVDESSRFWEAVVAVREHRDVEKFAKQAAAIVPPAATAALDAAVVNLRDVLQIQG